MENTLENKQEKNNEGMSNVKFIIKNAGSNRIKIYLSALFSFIASLCKLVPYILIYHILNEMRLASPDLSKIKYYVILACIAVIVNVISFTLSLGLSHIAAYDILHEIRLKTIEHMGNLNLGFFRKNTSGKIKKALDEDVEKLELFIAHQIPDLVESILTPLVVMIYLMTVKWYLAILLFIPFFLALGAQAWVYRNYNKTMDDYNKVLKNLHSTIIQYIYGINIFKAFNLTAKTFKNYINTVNEYLTFWLKICDDTLKSYTFGATIIDGAGLLITIPIGGILYLNGRLDFGGYIIFLLLSTVFLASFMKLINLGGNLAILLKGAENIKEIMTVPIQKSKHKIKLEKVEGNIEFRNVNFKYDTKEVLSNLNLSLKSNTRTALVGPSGSGKTTIGMLIGRFWDVEDGGIYLDGVNINDIDVKDIMDNTAFVFQDAHMINDSIYNNVLMGLDKSKEELIEACKAAQIHDFIEGLDNSYDTVIGAGTGIKLSGGEKQRLSIARAILKDAPILILDEVTSYSDIDNEKNIQKALLNLMKNKTVIIIAHRLYTIKNSDKIVVLDKGEKIQEGKHLELLAEDGLYKKLWEIGMDGGSNV